MPINRTIHQFLFQFTSTRHTENTFGEEGKIQSLLYVSVYETLQCRMKLEKRGSLATNTNLPIEQNRRSVSTGRSTKLTRSRLKLISRNFSLGRKRYFGKARSLLFLWVFGTRISAWRFDNSPNWGIGMWKQKKFWTTANKPRDSKWTLLNLKMHCRIQHFA